MPSASIRLQPESASPVSQGPPLRAIPATSSGFPAGGSAGGVPSDPTPACRHCGKEQVIAWGVFRTRQDERRQRFRCLSCHRTFSVFTGTPLEDIKLTDRWPDLTQCMAAGLSLRATAARLGIHLSTAFRWRHRLLQALDNQSQTHLRGNVAAGLAYVPYSEKGSGSAWDPWPPTCVLLLCDEGQGSAATIIGAGLRSRPCPGDAAAFPLDRVATDAVLCTAAASRYFRQLCRDTGVGYRGAVAPRLVASIGAFRAGLSRWLRAFRGVATRYLQNYLHWFRVTMLPEPHRQRPAAAQLLAVAVGCGDRSGGAGGHQNHESPGRRHERRSPSGSAPLTRGAAVRRSLHGRRGQHAARTARARGAHDPRSRRMQVISGRCQVVRSTCHPRSGGAPPRPSDPQQRRTNPDGIEEIEEIHKVPWEATRLFAYSILTISLRRRLKIRFSSREM